MANITNQLQKQGVREGLGDAVEAQTKEAASDRQRKAVRRTAYGRRIVPGVSFRLSAQEKAEIRERASSLAETGVEHVHVTGRQLEEMQSRSEDKGERKFPLVHICLLRYPVLHASGAADGKNASSPQCASCLRQVARLSICAQLQLFVEGLQMSIPAGF